MAVVKTIDQQAASPGDLPSLSLHVTNQDDKTAQNVIVTDELASYLDPLDYSTTKGTVSASGRTITAQIGTLSPGEYVVVRVRAYLNATASGAGTNSATVTVDNSDSDSKNNSSTVGFPVNQAAPTGHSRSGSDTTSCPTNTSTNGAYKGTSPYQAPGHR